MPLTMAVSQPSWLLLRLIYDRYTKYPISYQTYTTYFQALQVIKRHSGHADTEHEGLTWVLIRRWR